jgi:hypothetical protein
MNFKKKTRKQNRFKKVASKVSVSIQNRDRTIYKKIVIICASLKRHSIDSEMTIIIKANKPSLDRFIVSILQEIYNKKGVNF